MITGKSLADHREKKFSTATTDAPKRTKEDLLGGRHSSLYHPYYLLLNLDLVRHGSFTRSVPPNSLGNVKSVSTRYTLSKIYKLCMSEAIDLI